ncbi:response regulator [Streptomyces poriferorum]|uniref:response regulator n=1 Tax=Streptomyces poriferorum TaxID=2798799 RepID=UPI001C6039C3|nr:MULTISPECIES: response regulator [Streptomyces]MBW5252144.1 response regulator [Streptomyces poriferorum]MBW5257487.1 response regulator [Streptomyces poriferorum]WLQ49389.1 response regulator [Streptomyces sp. Alt1]
MSGPAGEQRIDHDLVWVVEDSAEDAEAIARALRRTHPGLALDFTDRGTGFVERLLGAARRPGLVLLDLKLPGPSGADVLRSIRSRPELDGVAVVAFTSSTGPDEVDTTYAAGADSYIYKPVNFELFRAVLKGAVDYWQRKAKSGDEGPGAQPPS